MFALRPMSWLACLAAPVAAVAQPIGFHVVEPLPGHDFTEISGLSSDGTRSVGVSTRNTGGSWRSFIREVDGDLRLCSPSFSQGVPRFISGDGRYTAGTGAEPPEYQNEYSFRRDGCSSEQRLTPIYSRVWDINHDGSVIVGGRQFIIEPFVSGYVASRWTESGGFQTIIEEGDPRFWSSMATGVSADGNVVVGHGFGWEGGTDGPERSFRWTPGGGLEILPGSGDVVANAVSSDGSRIVGTAYLDDGRRHNVMWHDGRIIDIGLTVTGSGQPQVVSNSGMILLDTRNFSRNANVWTPAMSAAMPLPDYIESFGIDVPDGWVLFEAVGVSDDGRTIAGSARRPDGQFRGFVVTVPSAPTAALLFAASAVCVRRRSLA